MNFYATPISEAFLVSRPKLAGPGTHWGVLVRRWAAPFGFQRGFLDVFGHNGLGSECVYELTRGGFQSVAVDGFLRGLPLAFVAQATSRDQVTSIEGRLQLLTTGEVEYQLFKQNCEHAANWLFYGEARSHQIEGLLVLAGIAGFAVMASRG